MPSLTWTIRPRSASSSSRAEPRSPPAGRAARRGQRSCSRLAPRRGRRPRRAEHRVLPQPGDALRLVKKVEQLAAGARGCGGSLEEAVKAAGLDGV